MCELFAFLGKHLLKHAEKELSSGMVVVTNYSTVNCFSSKMPAELSSISPCTHEEADTSCVELCARRPHTSYYPNR